MPCETTFKPAPHQAAGLTQEAVDAAEEKAIQKQVAAGRPASDPVVKVLSPGGKATDLEGEDKPKTAGDEVAGDKVTQKVEVKPPAPPKKPEAKKTDSKSDKGKPSR